MPGRVLAKGRLEVAAAILRWRSGVAILVHSVSSRAAALAATLEHGGFSITQIPGPQ